MSLRFDFDVKPEQEIGAQLNKMGITPKDVREVILTYMHTDHAGGLHHFPESRIYVNMPEYKRTLGLQGQLIGTFHSACQHGCHRLPSSLTIKGLDLLKILGCHQQW